MTISKRFEHKQILQLQRIKGGVNGKGTKKSAGQARSRPNML